MFGGCFGGVVCVGFTGSAGFRGDFDNDFSSTSCVVRPAAENETKIYLLISKSVIKNKIEETQIFCQELILTLSGSWCRSGSISVTIKLFDQ